ncbi:hypothetical protein V1527DRAFT_427203 [Lipomyces starkeyi]
MKKILKHSRSKSPSDSDATNTANPYAEDSRNLSGPAYNPYALGSNSYNSVPSYYSRNSPSPRTGTPLAGATSVIGPVTGVNNVSPARNNPYDVSSFSSPSSSSSSRRILTRPPAPVTDLTGTTPYINPYGNTSSTSTNLQRQELLGRPAIVSDENVAAQTYDYDPSIMETEAEREARHAGEEILRQGQEYLFSEQSLYVQIQEQEQEEEDLEVNALKEQIRHTNKQSLTSADNALRYAEEAEASGLRTLQALGEQGDQLGSAENSVAVTENQTKLAENYASELKSLNRSMFAVHVSNPFNSRRRLMEQEDKIRNTFRAQQIDKETNRRRQYESQQRRRRQLTATEMRYREQMARQKADLAQASRFQFEPDDEDFEVERDIDATLDDVSAAANRLNSMAKSINTELESQNHRVGKLNQKTQEVEIGVHLNTSRLARIR